VAVEASEQLGRIKKGTVEIIPEEDLTRRLEECLKNRRPLRVKYGADPSAPDIHLGHTVPIRKLREFQELGHQVVFIIGDFTATIGDPSGKSETRRQMLPEEVKQNAKTYTEQIFKILDRGRTEVVFNSEWFGRMSMPEVLKVTSFCTVAQMLARADFKERFEKNKDISLLEFLYPLLQGYDSIQVRADVEVGGTDQKFNLLMGRELQRSYGQVPQVILTMPLLEGTDGENKMSKSLGNYIGITENPKDMFGKLMSITDNLMVKYYELLTDTSPRELERIKAGLSDGTLHPRDVKRNLAFEITRMYHIHEEAQKAAEDFDRVFRDHELPRELTTFPVRENLLKDGKVWIVKLLVAVGFASTNSEARRLIGQGGVKINGKIIEDENLELQLTDGMILQSGKRNVIRLRLSP
jgi:tyrosyl-tRNA synthetase